MNLRFDFSIRDLYDQSKLEKLHSIFLLFCNSSSINTSSDIFQKKILEQAVYLEDFMALLFLNEKEVLTHRKTISKISCISWVRKNFIQKRVLTKYKQTIIKNSPLNPFDSLDEYECAKQIFDWLENVEEFAEKIEQAELFCAYQVQLFEKKNDQTTLFWKSEPVNSLDLLKDFTFTHHQVESLVLEKSPLEYTLKNDLPSVEYEINQASYCIHCHPQKKDSCRTGLKSSSGDVKENSLGAKLEGCPLDQKISEMNLLFSKGHFIAALAIAMIDNPLIAGTGHRICVDCKQACIFQKQTQVDVPGIETQILESVLNLPYGPEIYSLLTRWNPLNIENPLPKAATGNKVLVVGTGPAGFTLAHYLLREGITVVAIDTAKIEPLENGWIDIFSDDFKVMYSWNSMQKSMYQRIPQGFGGVCEYGITSRWNKNYLDLIRIILQRNSSFLLIGGIRFGGALGFEKAFSLGFDHVALCLGAGLSKGLKPDWMKIAGVHFATDFLMTLHLGAAYHLQSLFQFKLELPIVVLGGGLTAVDCAVEARSFYVQQVLKFKHRYDALKISLSDHEIRQDWTAQENELADTYLAHACEIDKVDVQQNLEKIHSLIDQWGGVTLLYRKDIIQSPAYRINVEELKAALNEGIKVIYDEELADIHSDEKGCIAQIQTTERTLACKTLLLGTGLKPNVSIAHDEDCLIIENSYLKTMDDGDLDNPLLNVKNAKFQNKISCFGDLNSRYHGSVVKAMASAKKGYPYILDSLKQNAFQDSNLLENGNFLTQWKNLTEIYVQKIVRFDHWLEVTIHASLQAQAYRPGFIYKLNRYFINNKAEKTPYSEGVALSPLKVDGRTLTFLIHQAGASSYSMNNLRVHEQVSLTGPSGDLFELYENQNVVLVALPQTLSTLVMYREQLILKNCKVFLVVYIQSEHDQTVFDTFKINYIPSAIEGKDYTLCSLDKLKDTLKDISEKVKDVIQWKIHGSNDLNTLVMDELKKISRSSNKLTVDYSVFNPVQCMSKGICSRCVYYKEGSDQPIYACMCYQQKKDIHQSSDAIILRDHSHGPLNKLDYTYVKYIGSRRT
ncbi:MAG: hypothetical protein C0432_04885 [Candidatus Puniceispirillum sp.]|nr:hypothetical protein [Candidatus Pelagibacter sp.]MBA4283609.1 hypothetical protein [Candidatus Puniceispirillum sp.]